MVSEPLRLKAHVLHTDEVCWARDDIEAALRELANADQVVLGFDIMELLPGGSPCIQGTSAYDMDAFLPSKSWKECVALALELSIKDVRDTQRLTGLKAPHSHLWYCVVTVDQLGAAKLKPGEILVKLPAKQDDT